MFEPQKLVVAAEARDLRRKNVQGSVVRVEPRVQRIALDLPAVRDGGGFARLPPEFRVDIPVQFAQVRFLDAKGRLNRHVRGQCLTETDLAAAGIFAVAGGAPYPVGFVKQVESEGEGIAQKLRFRETEVVFVAPVADLHMQAQLLPAAGERRKIEQVKIVEANLGVYAQPVFRAVARAKVEGARFAFLNVDQQISKQFVVRFVQRDAHLFEEARIVDAFFAFIHGCAVIALAWNQQHLPANDFVLGDVIARDTYLAQILQIALADVIDHMGGFLFLV